MPLGLGLMMGLGHNVASSGGGGLGPELLTNGDFASASSPPTIGGGSSISGGKLNCSGEGFPCSWSGVVTIGHTYRVSLAYNTASSPALRVGNGGATKDTKSLTGGSTDQTLTFADFVATGTGISIEADTSAYDGTIDNVSCKEVL
jgi:hypothetical protein